MYAQDRGDYPIIDTRRIGLRGRVVEEPITNNDNYTWFKIKYDCGIVGWSVENWLELV